MRTPRTIMLDALTRQYRQNHKFSDDWVAAQIEALDAAGYVIVSKEEWRKLQSLLPVLDAAKP